MLEKIVNRLVSVKSIVTIALTIIFSVLCFTGKLDQNFMTIYTMVISFYFVSQAKKDDEEPKKDTGKEDGGGTQ